MTISQNEIEPEAGRPIWTKGFFSQPRKCMNAITTTVRFIGAVKPKSCEDWFRYCDKLTEIKNIENLYTNECTNMKYMFYKCSNLTSLDLSNFNTSKVTDMLCMFEKCSNLTSLDVSHFDTSKVTVMQNMFRDCSSLTSLDLSKWNIVNAINMYQIFQGCSNLKSITVTQTVKDAIYNSYTELPSDVNWIIK